MRQLDDPPLRAYSVVYKNKIYLQIWIDNTPGDNTKVFNGIRRARIFLKPPPAGLPEADLAQQDAVDIPCARVKAHWLNISASHGAQNPTSQVSSGTGQIDVQSEHGPIGWALYLYPDWGPLTELSDKFTLVAEHYEEADGELKLYVGVANRKSEEKKKNRRSLADHLFEGQISVSNTHSPFHKLLGLDAREEAKGFKHSREGLSGSTNQFGLKLQFQVVINNDSALPPFKIAVPKTREVQFEIRPLNVSSGARRWAVSARPLRGEKDPPAFKPGDPMDAVSRDLLKAWNQLVWRPFFVALRTIKSGSPGSFVPNLVTTVGPAYWRFNYRIEQQKKGTPDLLQLETILADGENYVHASFDGCVDHSKSALQRLIILGGAEPAIEDGSILFSFRLLDAPFDPEDADKKSATAKWRADHRGETPPFRIGSLDLFLHQDSAAEDQSQAWSDQRKDNVGDLEARLRAGVDGEAPSLTNLRIRSLRFLLAGFSVGGQDQPPSVERTPIEAPLAIEHQGIGRPNGPAVKELLAFDVVEESTGGGDNHSLSLRLERVPLPAGKPVAADPHGLIIIDPAPFLVAAVRWRLPRAEKKELANWVSERVGGSYWRFRDDLRRAEIHLPPQAVGEQFIREYDRADVRKPIDYRFSPAASIVLDLSERRREFVEAPWNLRRLLGYPDQRAVGTAIRSIELEMLYGLSARIDAENLYLAELASRTGHVARAPRFPGLEPTEAGAAATAWLTPNFSEFAERIRRLRAALRARLAWLQPGPSEFLEWNGQIDRGVEFRFRANRQTHRPYGAIGDNGLRGGVDFGFESRNIYDRVTKATHSDAGLFRGLILSALGASGFSKAEFDSRLTSIYCDAYVGRTFYYSLERIGRIRCLWNRARHVVVYERSVVDSEQFKDNALTGSWRGRAVVRKVREFVEILQPLRPYPDLDGEARATGFLLGAHFPSPIIPVDSKWGRDEPEGWAVPLYQPGDPFYKPPDVFLLLAAPPTEKEGQPPPIAARVVSVERLEFFTYAPPFDPNQKISGNPDEWPSIPEIDFPIAPHPKVEQAEAAADDRPQPDAEDLPADYRPYTLLVDTGERPVDIMHGRSAKPVATLIHEVLVARCRAGSESAESVAAEPELKDATSQRKTLNDWATSAATASAAIAQLAFEPNSGWPGKVADWPLKNPSELDGLWNKIRDNSTKLFDEWQKQFKAPTEVGVPPAFKRAIDTIAELRGQLSKVAADESGRDERDRCAHAIRSALDAMTTAVAAYNDPLLNVVRDIEKSRSRLKRLAEWTESFGNLPRHPATGPLAALHERLRSAKLPATSAVAGKLARERADSLRQLTGDLWQCLTTLLAASESARVDARREAGRAADSLFEIDGPLGRMREWTDDAFQLVAQPIAKLDALRKTYEELAARAERGEDVLAELPPDADGQFKKSIELAGEMADSLGPTIRGTVGFVDAAAARLDLCLAAARDSTDQIGRWIESSPLGLTVEELKVTLGTDEDAKKWFEGLRKEMNGVAGRLEAVQQGAVKLVTAVSDPTVALPDSLKPVLQKFGGIDTLRTLGSAFGRGPADFDQERCACENRLDRWRSLLGTSLGNDLIQRAWREFAQGALSDLAAFKSRFEAALSDFRGGILRVPDVYKKAKDAGERALRFLAARGVAPVTDSMQFSRKIVNFHFDQLSNRVQFSPSRLLFNRFRPGVGLDGLGASIDTSPLKSLGIRLPTGELGEFFKPDLPALKNFSLGKILPDFGGVNLEKLFGEVRIPDGGDSPIKVTHGFDKSTKRAWAQAEVKFDLDRPAEIFRLGCIVMQLESAHFDSAIRMTVGADGTQQREIRAALEGHWKLIVGKPIVTLVGAALRYQPDGQVRFEVSPTNVRVEPPLNFLAKLLEKFSPGGGGSDGDEGDDDASGVTIRLIKDNLGLPAGAEAILNLALPNLTVGAFAISGLALHARMALSMQGGFRDFSISVAVSLASRDHPFTLVILFLGGGGFFESILTYYPLRERHRIQCRLSIGIVAVAALGIDLGFARGGVSITLGFSLEFVTANGNSTVEVELRLVIVGELDVLGIISAYIMLALIARYAQGKLVCTGKFVLRIKICWCFTLKISKSVTFTVGGGAGQTAAMLERHAEICYAFEAERRRYASAGQLPALPARSNSLREMEHWVRQAVRMYVHTFGEDDDAD